MIYKQYNLDMFISNFLAVRSNFSREAITLLFDYYESIGEPIEFDPIAMCCDWSEYSDPLEALEDEFLVPDPQTLESFCNEYDFHSSTPAQALEDFLGRTVLWDGENCFLVGV